MGGNNISNIDNLTRQRDAVNKNSVDNMVMTTRTYIDIKADEHVNKSGDQMTGNLSILGNNLTQLCDPFRHRDAVHERYARQWNVWGPTNERASYQGIASELYYKQ